MMGLWVRTAALSLLLLQQLVLTVTAEGTGKYWLFTVHALLEDII